MMYSNYFSKPKKNSNILRFTPPGFKYSIDVPFPGRVLPVCARCKKNFKTREHCRTKECHYGLPWTDTYLCISLDPTCTGPDGKLLDGPFMAQGVPSTAYQYTDFIDPKTPSCGPCKEKNYTRTYCRTNKKHRTLPWSTVYVVLTLRPDGVIPPPDEEPNLEIIKEMNAKRRKVNSSGGKKATPTAESEATTASNAPLSPTVKVHINLDADDDKVGTSDSISGTAADTDKKNDTAENTTNEADSTKKDTEDKKDDNKDDIKDGIINESKNEDSKADNNNNDNNNDTTADGNKNENEEKKEGDNVDKEKDTTTTTNDSTNDDGNSNDKAKSESAKINDTTSTTNEAEKIEVVETKVVVVDENSKEVQAAKLAEIHPSRTFLTTVSVHRCKVEWVEFDPSQQASQNRIREEMSQKIQEEQQQTGAFPSPYGMLHPPMGMPPMMMNQPFHHHPNMKDDPNSVGGPQGGGSVNSGGGPGSQGQGGNNNGPPPQDPNHNHGIVHGHMHGHGHGHAHSPNQHQHPHWNMPPPGAFPSQQEMMYQSQMGFDPRMAYGFHPPWGRGHPSMDPGMMHFAGADGQGNPMMHQMGWGGGSFYGAPMPPHPGMVGGNQNGGGGGEMPQSMGQRESPGRPMNNNAPGKDGNGMNDPKSPNDSKPQEETI